MLMHIDVGHSVYRCKVCLPIVRIPTLGTMHLDNLAQAVADQLGAPYHIRSKYHFAAPTSDGIVERTVDAAIFSYRQPTVRLSHA